MNQIIFFSGTFFCRYLIVLAIVAVATGATAVAQDGQYSQDFQASAPPSDFPAHTIFDPHVQPADLIAQNSANVPAQQASHQETPSDIIGSSGSMLSNLSSTVQKQWQSGEWNKHVGSYFNDIDISRMLGSLAIVLGGYFAFVWFSRQLGGSNGQVPSDVVEVLGQVPFGPKKHLQIVRLGSKLLLLVNGPEGTHPIGEITDPNEVEYLASLCPRKKTASGERALSIAKAAVSRNASPTVNISSNNAPQPTATAATNPNHLAAILQSLNGQSGNAAVFDS